MGAHGQWNKALSKVTMTLWQGLSATNSLSRMKASLRNRRWGIGSLIGAAALVASYVLWSFNRPPFPLTRLAELNATMNTNDVQNVLGPPRKTWTRVNGTGQAHTEWAYARPLSWSIVYIYFTPDGRFQKHRYDY